MAKILVFSRQCLFYWLCQADATSTIKIFITPFLIRHSHKVHLQTAEACRAGSRVSDSLHYHSMHMCQQTLPRPLRSSTLPSTLFSPTLGPPPWICTNLRILDLILSRHLLVSEGIYSSSNPWDEEKYKQECAGLMFSRIGLLAELEELGLDFNGEKDGYHDYDGENGSSRAGEDQQTLILPVGLKVGSALRDLRDHPARRQEWVKRNMSL
ncbi:hypothetical protein EDD21DRAFT_389860, partial [Dissophora ornata]